MHHRNKRNKKKRGFTFIELLVVVAIIGLLAATTLIATNSARIQSRDTKRIADVNSLALALELYSENNNSLYPQPEVMMGMVYSDQPEWQVLENMLAPYLAKLPLGLTRRYIYAAPGNNTLCLTSSGGISVKKDGFYIATELETYPHKTAMQDGGPVGHFYERFGGKAVTFSGINCP